MTSKRYLYTPVILLILIFVAVLGTTPSIDAQEIHALLIIMDDDLDIRQSVDVNRLRVKKMLQLIDVNPEIWQADVRQITPDRISNWVRNCQVNVEDTIFIYYSGHGHIDHKSRHYLDLDVQNASLSMLRSDLVQELSRKGCRLKMLITDTCSNPVQTSPPRVESAGTVVSRKHRYAEDLFLKHRGFLDITAASPGQYAWGNNQIGGYFTAALIESFIPKSDTDEDGFLSWKEVFSAARDETQQLFSATTFLPFDERKKNKIGQTTQTPKAYSLPNRIRLFNAQNFSATDWKTLSGYSSYVWHVEFSPKSTYFALTVDDNTTELYNKDWKLIWRYQGSCEDEHHHAGILAFSPDEKYLAIGAHGNRNEISILRLSDLRVIQILQGHSDAIRSVSFDPASNYLASGSEDKTIRIWRYTGSRFTPHQTLTEHSDIVWNVSFDPTGNYLASGGRDNILGIWRRNGNRFAHIQALRQHSDCVRSVSFSPDGKYLVSGSCDETIKIWQHAGSQFNHTQTLTEHSSNVWDVSFSPDGKYLASSSGDKTIKIWRDNGSQFTYLQTLRHHTDDVNSISFSPDARFLASGSDGKQARIWQVEGIHSYRQQAVPPVRSGPKAIDFQVRDLNGNPLSLRKYRGKVILLDFWATWCGPCLTEMPNIKQIYQKYKNQNFQIIGISLDTNGSSLRSYLKREGITWPQFFDGAGWNNSIAQKYGINSIPRMYLIDGNGTIRKENVRGHALEIAVDELVRENNRKGQYR